MSSTSRRLWRTLTWPVRVLFGFVRRSALLSLLVWCLLILGTGYLAVTSERVAGLFTQLAGRVAQSPTLQDKANAERTALVAEHAAAIETRDTVDAALRAEIETLEDRLESLQAEAERAKAATDRHIFLLEGEVLVLKDDLADALAMAPAEADPPASDEPADE